VREYCRKHPKGLLLGNAKNIVGSFKCFDWDQNSWRDEVLLGAENRRGLSGVSFYEILV
jgi:hypothetical protein